MKRTVLASMAAVPALLLAALLVPAVAAAAGPVTTATSCSGTTAVTCNLWAEPGTLALPGPTSVPVWGFATASGGSPSVPGPAIVVNQGATVTVNLVNHLPQATSLVFEGLATAPDLASVAASGGSHQYTFTAATPGTFLYEAGILPGSEYQASMGLHGVLIVRPTGHPDQAYGAAATAFADEALVVVSEIDPALNTSTSPQSFDLRAFAPRWFLVNGKAYTTAGATSIPVSSGASLLMRYVNAGNLHHSMGVLGLHQRVLAANGSELPAQRTMVAETIAPGQTADVLVSLPATAAASTLYPVYDASLLLNNSTASGIGGMLALLDASATASGSDTTGPVTSGVTLTETAPGSGLYTLTASTSDATTGNANVAAAEYRLDSVVAAPTAMAASDAAFDSPTEAVTSATGAIDASTLSSGTHTLYVRGQDALGNWGVNASTTLVLDKTGPTTSALGLNPNPSSGSVPVALSGTASDVASGNSNIDAAEFFVGAPGPDGSGTPLTLNKVATVVSLSGTIPAPGSSTVVYVHAHDAAGATGNWGAFASINLTVDGAGPTTSSVAANPPANNGSYGQSSSNPSVRITASVSDAASGGATVAAAEGFIDAAGANGTGFPFVASDGTWNTTTETVIADIPLSTITQLTSGGHTIYVHGRDAVGNWGTSATLAYLIDRTAPTFSSISLAPNPTNGAAAITLTVNGAADPAGPGGASGVAGGEYWIDLATPPAAGSGTRFSGLTASIPTAGLTTGNHTIGARIRDAAGNWSTTTASATVLVVPDAIFANGFETGTAPWGWTSRSTTSTTRLNVTSAAALVGSLGLQAQGNNTNYVQYNFGTAAQPATATYDARFYFRPNGQSSTGKDILQAATSSTFGTIPFRVRYRLNGTTPQVQIQVGGTANPSWVNVLGGTSSNYLEAVWQSGGTLQLYVNGTLSQTLTATANPIAAVRLGSVTSTGNATLMYFDAFASKRSVSPLVGP